MWLCFPLNVYLHFKNTNGVVLPLTCPLSFFLVPGFCPLLVVFAASPLLSSVSPQPPSPWLPYQLVLPHQIWMRTCLQSLERQPGMYPRCWCLPLPSVHCEASGLTWAFAVELRDKKEVSTALSNIISEN